MARIYSGRDVGKYVEPVLESSRMRLLVVSPFISREYASLLAEKARQGVMVFVVTVDNPHTRRALEVFRRTCQRVRIRLRAPVFAALVALVGLAPLAAWLLLGRVAADLVVVVGALLLSLHIALRPPSWHWLAAMAGAAAAGIAASLVLGGVGDPGRAAYQAAFSIAAAAYGVGGAYLAYTFGVKRVVRTPRLAGGLHVIVLPPGRSVHTKMVIGDSVAVAGSANLTRRGLWRNMETITIYEGAELGELMRQFTAIWEDARRNMQEYIGCGRVNPVYT